MVFDEDQFIKSRPHMEEFLGLLLHFQHFRQFINGRIEKLKNRIPDRDLFDDEVLQYEEGGLIRVIIINPLRMRRRVTVVCLSVCVCVCMSFTALTARVLNFAVQAW